MENLNDPFEGLYVERLKFREAKDVSADEVQQVLQFIAEKYGKEIEPSSNLNVANLTPDELYIEQENISRTMDGLIKDLNQLKDDIFVCCFNQDKMVKALEHKLMWAHYANGLRGIAIEFDGEALEVSIKTANKKLHEDGKHYLEGKGMDYDGLYGMDSLDLMLNFGRGNGRRPR